MRKLMMATVLTGLSCVVVGCSEGDAPAPNVVETKTVEPNGAPVASTSEAESDAPSKLDLVEPTPMPTPNPAPDTVPAVKLTPADAPNPANEPTATAGLTIGDTAPPISIAKWIKGDPIEGFTSDKVFVVEFWATWCGPCLAGMPHIASLQTEYGDKVKFIGVSAEEEEVVTEFMGQESRDGKLWSEVLTYTIALDNNRQTNAAYMEAAGQNGIPCAFVVGKSGNVEWIGHPAAIDDVLKQVVDGTWDPTAARAALLAEQEADKVMQQIGPKIQAALQSGDFKAAVSLIDQLIEKSPENGQFKQARFQFLLQGEMFDEANKAAEEMIKASNDSAMELNQLAWTLATAVPGPGPDLDLALTAAKRAEELTESKDASILDTVGRILFKKGNIEDAIAIQKKALEIVAPEMKEQLEASLKEYEAALKGDDTEAKPLQPDAATPAEGDAAQPAEGDAAQPAEGDAAKPADEAGK